MEHRYCIKEKLLCVFPNQTVIERAFQLLFYVIINQVFFSYILIRGADHCDTTTAFSKLVGSWHSCLGELSAFGWQLKDAMRASKAAFDLKTKNPYLIVG